MDVSIYNKSFVKKKTKFETEQLEKLFKKTQIGQNIHRKWIGAKKGSREKCGLVEKNVIVETHVLVGKCVFVEKLYWLEKMNL